MCALLVESKKNSKDIFSSRLHYTPSRCRDHIHRCASDLRPVCVYRQPKLSWWPVVYFLETQHLAVNVLFYAALYLLTFFSDMLMVSGPSTFSSSNSDYSNISCGAVGLSGLHLVILVV